MFQLTAECHETRESRIIFYGVVSANLHFVRRESIEYFLFLRYADFSQASVVLEMISNLEAPLGRANY